MPGLAATTNSAECRLCIGLDPTLRGHALTRSCTMSYRLLLMAMLAVPSWQVSAQDQETDSGARILAPFKQDLQAALRAGLAEGPIAAISACRLQAPGIAKAQSTNGIRVGRTSHRLRNPSNIAPAWVAPLLDAYAADSAGRDPRTVTIGDGRAGYVEPVLIQPLCLTCHGNALAPDIAARLQELYPDDRATGYDIGDLRGVFWVEYPTAAGLSARLESRPYLRRHSCEPERRNRAKRRTRIRSWIRSQLRSIHHYTGR